MPDQTPQETATVFDYRKYTRDREFGELLAMDRPEECTGPMEEFLIGFITDEMRDVFPQVAVEFLGKEAFLQDPEKRSILNRMHRPAQLRARSGE